MSNKTVVNSLADGIVQLAILCIYMRRIINYDWATVNIFDTTKKHFISEWYFSTNHEIGSRVLRKVKKSWESIEGRIVSLDQLWSRTASAEQIFSSCLSPGRVKKLHMFINFGLKVDHGAILKHSESTWLSYSSVKCTKWFIILHQKLWAAKSRETAVILVTLCFGALCFGEAIDLVAMSLYVRIT